MTSLAFKLSVDPAPAQFLLTVHGKPAAADREKTRLAHNQAAGSDQGVAAARSFGDLSHSVFVPSGEDAGNDLLFIDYWNSVDGLMTFFSDKQVEAGGRMVFAEREAVLWSASPGLPRVNLPAPAGRNDRFLGLVRGPVASHAAAENLVTEATRMALNTARAKGLMTREWYFRMTPPGEKPSLEAIGVDLWFDAKGMEEIYSDPNEMAPLGGLFTAAPMTSVWQKPAGTWVEW